MVRNVANLVPPYTPDGAQRAVSAALEFAVQALKVKHIVVLGHAQCGGIRAFAEESEPLSPGDFIGRWMEMIAPAATRSGRAAHMPMNRLSAAARAGLIVNSLDNLMTFPCVRILVERGKLQSARRLFRRRDREPLSVLDRSRAGEIQAGGARFRAPPHAGRARGSRSRHRRLLNVRARRMTDYAAFFFA